LEELEDTEKAACIDTDVLIDYPRKEQGISAYKSWQKKGTTLVTSVSAFELQLGAELPKDKYRDPEKSQVC
jgi:predicted nucleic acid-binding protein